MTLNSTVHFYDHDGSRLFLDSGKVLRIRKNPFRSADEALEPLTRWARQLHLIAEQDVIATFN